MGLASPPFVCTGSGLCALPFGGTGFSQTEALPVKGIGGPDESDGPEAGASDQKQGISKSSG